MKLELIHNQTDPHRWEIQLDRHETGDYVFERPATPGRYFIVLKTSSYNALGTQVPYASFDDVRRQLEFYYRFS